MTPAKTLRLGKGLALPVAAVTRTVAVVGQKGTGKTSTAVVLVEEAAAAGARFAWMDPTGAASGLRANAKGDGPGLDCVVMGGYNGDVPLSSGAGAVVARLVVVEGYSIVCDLERMPRSEQITFVADFAEAALELCRSAVLVVFDEAPRFAPQGGAGIDDDGTRCRVAVTEAVMLGRRKGLGTILISQRPSKLHKDVLEQADVLIAHRLMGNNDRKAIKGWLEDHEEGDDWLARISSLDTGQAVVLGPEYRVGGVFQVRAKRTFDSSATPEVGAELLDAPQRASIDLADLEAKMGTALEAAQENDPAALKRKVERLERQLEEGGGADVEELRAACARIADLEANQLGDGQRAELRVRFHNADESADALERVMTQLHDELDRLATGLLDIGVDLDFTADDGAARSAPTGEKGVQSVAAPTAPAQGDRAPDQQSNGDGRAPSSSPAGGGNAVDAGGARAQPASSIERRPPPADPARRADQPELVAGARRMLDALRRYPPLTRAELATLANSFGGSMRTNLSALKGLGYVDEQDGRVALTAEGDMAAGGPAKPWTPDEVIAKHSGKLVAGARRVLGVVMRGGLDGGFTRAELERLADSKGGSFRTNLSKLKTLGLVEERNRRVYPGHALYARQIAHRR